MSSTSTGPTDPLGSDAGSRGEPVTGPDAGSHAGSAAEPVATRGAADRAATPPLRCVVVTPYATLGGSERWLLALLDGAAARLDAEVWLLEDGPLRAELERRDVPTLVLPTGADARSLAARGADLARRLRAGDADVLLANGVKAAAAAVPAARLVGVPVVWAKHDFSFDSTLARPLGALADAVLATSAAVAAATGRDDVALVPPPRPAREPASRLEAQAFWSAAGAPVPADAPAAGRRTLAMLTRLVAYKGVDTAIAALAEPAAAGWDLLVVGPDDPSEPGERARLETLAADLGVAGRVRLVPEVDDAGHWLAAVDAVAVLTRSAGAFGREGYSLVALEALAAGVPLLGGRGNPEVERMAAAAGRVVATGDPATPDGARAVADVARGLAELGDPDVRRATRLGAERLHAAHPDAATCTALTVGLLAETAGRPGAGLAPAEPVTVLTCFKDEAGHVDAVVARVVEQLGPDDEYLLVDDHSTDGTSEELAAWARREPRIRVLPGPGINLSAARNHGFAHATHAVVACTDAGVEPAPGWLDALRTPFAERLPAAPSDTAAAADQGGPASPLGPDAVASSGRGVDLVVGVYEVDGGDPWRDAARLALFPAVAEARRRTPLVRMAGTLTGRRFDAARLDGRSMACTVEAWKRAGGFDESLYSSEDAVFGSAVRAAGGRSVLALDACVTWAQSGRIGETAAMYRKYGEWGGRAGSWPLVSRDLVRGSAYLVAPVLAVRGGAATRALLALGALGYLAVPLSRARAEHADPATVALMPLALALKDVAKAVGCARGSLGRLRGDRA
ncbi:glycosyltransferase [Nocardioides sp. Leaf285]|uniref:glycosyltransferase n=1 Tax=Nocardioides sp. Leaf285 TaxID=1736322 RepID=UPI000703A336|nr:glycosyltransferase [Nocardioides sp. Leaf285]KQP66489.1 hypothetical protein ASF47_01445 [Nocardioides sp. Leaf285]